MAKQLSIKLAETVPGIALYWIFVNDCQKRESSIVRLPRRLEEEGGGKGTAPSRINHAARLPGFGGRGAGRAASCDHDVLEGSGRKEDIRRPPGAGMSLYPTFLIRHLCVSPIDVGGRSSHSPSTSIIKLLQYIESTRDNYSCDLKEVTKAATPAPKPSRRHFCLEFHVLPCVLILVVGRRQYFIPPIPSCHLSRHVPRSQINTLLDDAEPLAHCPPPPPHFGENEIDHSGITPEFSQLENAADVAVVAWFSCGASCYTRLYPVVALHTFTLISSHSFVPDDWGILVGLTSRAAGFFSPVDLISRIFERDKACENLYVFKDIFDAGCVRQCSERIYGNNYHVLASSSAASFVQSISVDETSQENSKSTGRQQGAGSEMEVRDRQALRAAVAEQIACSPSTKAIRVQSSVGSLRIFAYGNRSGRCRWSAGFPGDLPFPPLLHSSAALYSPQSPSSDLKTSMQGPRKERTSLLVVLGANLWRRKEHYHTNERLTPIRDGVVSIARTSNQRLWEKQETIPEDGESREFNIVFVCFRDNFPKFLPEVFINWEEFQLEKYIPKCRRGSKPFRALCKTIRTQTLFARIFCCRSSDGARLIARNLRFESAGAGIHEKSEEGGVVSRGAMGEHLALTSAYMFRRLNVIVRLLAGRGSLWIAHGIAECLVLSTAENGKVAVYSKECWSHLFYYELFDRFTYRVVCIFIQPTFVKAVHDKVSTLEMDLRKKSLLLPAYI
ncbi:hypothetical protein PR048_003195 [Dryococelus australis]|uniref:Uncharacterized protein n=1 Tax=Dryococelus australis TaxID=614101 RepID=A0ABQ9IMF1_9NEOP|nr:hypothetical protein PR048_003195 [Dryococelus australis]